MHVCCLHIPAFPAWVFDHRTHERGVTVAVSGGRVVAAGKAAQRKGVVPGMHAERVQTLCPKVVLHTRDRQLERAAWDEVLHEIYTVTPFLEGREPPFAFFVPGHLEATRTLIERLHARAGIGPWRSIARLAAIRAAPGNVLNVREQAVPAFLERFPVALLEELDFSEETIEQLDLFGFQTLGGAARLSERHLRGQFGEEGTRLYTLLHDREEASVSLYRQPPAIEENYDLDRPCREPGDLEPVLAFLVRRAASRLGRYQCQRVKLNLGGRGRDVWAARTLRQPTNEARRVQYTTETLLRHLLSPDMEVDRLSLELGTLREARPEQAFLFVRRPAVGEAVKTVHRRYPGAVLRAVMRPHTLLAEDEVYMESWDRSG